MSKLLLLFQILQRENGGMQYTSSHISFVLIVLMVLSENSLTGSIPSELGNLDRMTTLEVGYNSFTGVVPSQICQSGSLQTLEADCYAVQCDCCTDCTPPRETTSPVVNTTTLAPTTVATEQATEAATTEEPTILPTASPTVCTSFLIWNTTCVRSGSPIPISFQNCEPQNGDWIGIYDKTADPTDLRTPYLWVWTCGSQNCRGAPQSNTVVLDETTVDSQGGSWPLADDTYVAYLIRNTGTPPYQAFLESDKMKIGNQPCQ